MLECLALVRAGSDQAPAHPSWARQGNATGGGTAKPLALSRCISTRAMMVKMSPELETHTSFCLLVPEHQTRARTEARDASRLKIKPPLALLRLQELGRAVPIPGITHPWSALVEAEMGRSPAAAHGRWCLPCSPTLPAPHTWVDVPGPPQGTFRVQLC